jgi:DNA-binding response OmpR family regulator
VAEVVAIRWPEEHEEAAHLVSAGVAVLYLVRAEDDPPIPSGCLEDWVRIPGDDRDFHARLAALELRATLHQAPPFVDDAGRLHHGGRIIPLTRQEARLAAALTAHVGDVVADNELLEALRNGTNPPTTTLRVEIGRLRTRLREVNLAIRRVGAGYMLHVRQ